MKRAYLWAVIAAGLLLAGELPMETHDAAELLPAELAIFWTEDGRVCARCDNGTEGSGEDLDAALDDLERAAEGVLFLDTAEHLILCGDIPSLAKQAADCGRLRPAAKVYRMADAALDAETAVDFLRAHPGNVTLGEVRAAMLGAGKAEMPELRETERGLRLIER